MVLITFIRHAESCSNIIEYDDTGTFPFQKLYNIPVNMRELIGGKISHPPLTFKGIQQAIILGVDYFNNEYNYDVLYCSPSLRTIMTALLALRTINYNRIINEYSPITIKLIPHLIELKNYAGSYDLQNAIIESEKLKLMVEYIKWWFTNKWFENFIDYELTSLINKLEILLIKLMEEIKKHYSSINELEILLIQKSIQNIFENLEIFKKCYDDNKKLLLNELIASIKELFINSQKLSLQIIDDIKQLNFKKFTNPLFYSSCDIDFNYTIQSPNIQLFIDFLNSQSTHKNILCFSHGAILKQTFKLSNKIKNTEIIKYNSDKKQIETHDEHIKTLPYTESTCANICGKLYDVDNMYLFGIINHLLSDSETQLPVSSLYYNSDPKFKLSLNIPSNIDLWKSEQLLKSEELSKSEGLSQSEDLSNSKSFVFVRKYLKYKYKYLKLLNKNSIV